MNLHHAAFQEMCKQAVTEYPFFPDAGYFMYFNTNAGQADEVAILESRILYPKRTQQCLQFFYRTTGSPSDKLIIWLKEDDGTGNIRKMRKIQTFQGNSENKMNNWVERRRSCLTLPMNTEDWLRNQDFPEVTRIACNTAKNFGITLSHLAEKLWNVIM